MHRKTILALTVWLALAGASLAQTPTVDPTLVYIPVAVNGPKNVYIPSLKKENFKLLEDGIEQTITTFYAEDQPMDINIILTLGALQRGRADLNSTKIRETLENFRQQGNPKNKYTVKKMPF